MKRFCLLAAAVAFSFVTISCDDDDKSGLELQAHDQNALMRIMHDSIMPMDTLAKTNDPDHDFAAMMRIHHQAAINMAEYTRDNNDNAEIDRIAGNVITMQTQEIQELTNFLTTHNPVAEIDGEEFHMEAMEAMDAMDRDMDLRIITGDADNDFAQLMIEHHESAVEMAQSLLDHGDNAEMRSMAEEMIEMQRMEIKELQEWLLNNRPS